MGDPVFDSTNFPSLKRDVSSTPKTVVHLGVFISVVMVPRRAV